MTHALRHFIQAQMDARRMAQADLVRESGLSRSHVSKLLGDSRDKLPQLPNEETISSLARAFRVKPGVVLAYAIEALGTGFRSEDFVYGVQSATDEELLAELGYRLGEGQSARLASRALEESIEDDATFSRAARKLGESAAGVDIDFDLAARRGLSEGKQLRRAQDEAGEESQDDGGEGSA